MIGYVELIFLIIFLTSTLGMLFIVFQKIPILSQLPEKQQPSFFGFNQKLKKITNKVKNLKNKLPNEIFFQKFLSKIKILNLKIENKINQCLQDLREKQRKKKENDDYWQKLKDSKEQ
jgi:hypothetical protein